MSKSKKMHKKEDIALKKVKTVSAKTQPPKQGDAL